ncbi:hypothetical protein [Silvimonas sp.]|uniref:hypothetical protein n=1 Tax=Silvimonas sp. TaxID=2650811 RepID=UPI002840798B|nr:hypothetical protein [Silvimonas sp.]MDR3429819.1 hypothetical protein [Silvimonas sp.]
MKLDPAKGRFLSALCFSLFCHSFLLVDVAWQGGSAPVVVDNPVFSVVIRQQVQVREAIGIRHSSGEIISAIPEAGGAEANGALVNIQPTQNETSAIKNESAQIAVQPPLPFIDSGTLDIHPVPRSAPNLISAAQRALQGSGKPIRIRVYILESGMVYRVSILQHDERDQDAADLIADALKRTGFVPGRLNGHDVATYMELEFKTGPNISGPRS